MRCNERRGHYLRARSPTGTITLYGGDIIMGLLWDCFTLVGGAYLRILCDGRRGHYLLELGYTEGPADSITLHEGGVIVILLCPASVVLT